MISYQGRVQVPSGTTIGSNVANGSGIYQLPDTNSHLYSNDFTGGSRLNHKHSDPL